MVALRGCAVSSQLSAELPWPESKSDELLPKVPLDILDYKEKLNLRRQRRTSCDRRDCCLSITGA